MNLVAVLTSVLSGLGVGLLVGLTGVGGGSLMTPLLILLFGVHTTTAVGTDLLYAAATKSAGTITHGLRGSVDWAITALLACGSIPGAILTIAMLYFLGVVGKSSPRILTVALGIALLLSAGCVLGQRQLRRLTARPSKSATVVHLILPLTVLAGFALGVLVTLTSVGAGALGMTMLVMLYPGKPINRLVGSDIAHAVPLTLIAGLGHWMLGSVNWALVASLLLGSVPGVIIGSHLSARMSDRIMRPILAAILVLVAVQMFRG